MLTTIEALCAETHNWFTDKPVIDDWKIEGGSLALPFLSVGQFFRIVGSKFNDGIYIMGPDGKVAHDIDWKLPFEEGHTWDPIPTVIWKEVEGFTLADEEFHGGIWPMSIPKSFIQLAEEIKTYNDSDMAKPTPYISESFGGYSYSKGVGSTGNADNSWQKVFGTKLKRWRKAANIC